MYPQSYLIGRYLRWSCFTKSRVSQLFLSEGRTRYNTTVEGPNILRNVICFGTCYILPNQQNFRNYIIFSLLTLTNGFAGRIWPAGRSLENPALSQLIDERNPRIENRSYIFVKALHFLL